METAERLEGAAELCAVLAAGLRAGLTPERCLEVAGAQPSDERMRLSAGGLVGACWDVAIENGSAPGQLLGRLAEMLGSMALSMRQAEVAATGPRATIRLVLWLPAASLLMAQLAGIPAISVVLTTPVGWFLLLVGVGLLWAARRWLTHLVSAAQRMSWAAGLAPDLVAMVLRSSGSPAAAWNLVRAIPAEGYLTTDAQARDAQCCTSALDQADEWGVPAASLLELRANMERRCGQHEREANIAALGVRVMLPLGVCVLPAFVVLAVVPTVLALLSSTTALGA